MKFTWLRVYGLCLSCFTLLMMLWGMIMKSHSGPDLFILVFSMIVLVIVLQQLEAYKTFLDKRHEELCTRIKQLKKK